MPRGAPRAFHSPGRPSEGTGAGIPLRRCPGFAGEEEEEQEEEPRVRRGATAHQARRRRTHSERRARAGAEPCKQVSVRCPRGPPLAGAASSGSGSRGSRRRGRRLVSPRGAVLGGRWAGAEAQPGSWGLRGRAGSHARGRALGDPGAGWAEPRAPGRGLKATEERCRGLRTSAVPPRSGASAMTVGLPGGLTWVSSAKLSPSREPV
ncbi:hypothetical protein H8959_010433 [Pygathrix nigripes]